MNQPSNPQPTGNNSYRWHVTQENKRRAKKRLTCEHKRVICFCADCKMNMATLKPVTKKEMGLRKVRMD